MNKYNAKGVWYDLKSQKIISPPTLKQRKTNRNLVHFDSMFEHRVYESLKLIFSAENIEIHPIVPVIKEPIKTYPDGVSWQADFAILDAWKNRRYLIEAKGCITEAFRLKMALLETYNLTSFYRVLLVFNQLPDEGTLKWLPDSVRLSSIEKHFHSLSKYQVS